MLYYKEIDEMNVAVCSSHFQTGLENSIRKNPNRCALLYAVLNA